jgi:hypothetical protein
VLFLISRIIAKQAAEGGFAGGDPAREIGERGASPEGAARPVPVDIAAIERHLRFPQTNGVRAFPSTVPMTMTRWS